MVKIISYSEDLARIRFIYKNSHKQVNIIYYIFCNFCKSIDNQISITTALYNHPDIYWNGSMLESYPPKLDIGYNSNNISRDDVISFMKKYNCTVISSA
jgi:hypothetical protein